MSRRLRYWLFTGEDAPAAPIRRLEEVGATVHQVSRASGGVSFEEVLAVCWASGIRSLFCEGGGRVASGLIRDRIGHNGSTSSWHPLCWVKQGVLAFPGLESSEAWDAWRPTEPARDFGRDVMLTFDRTG